MKIRGKTAGDVVREYFPGETDEFINNVLWNETGYPHWWHTGSHEGATPEECLRYQLGTAVERRTSCLIPGDVIGAEIRAAMDNFRARELEGGAQ